MPKFTVTVVADKLQLEWTPFGNGRYVVQYTNDLTKGWQQVAGPISEPRWSETLPADRTGYYRVAAYEP